jgi:hypothetical protein
VNPLPYRNIFAALRLTRAGDLVQATALLQRTLRGVAVPETRGETDLDRASDGVSPKNVALHLIDYAHPAEILARIASAAPRSHSKGATTSSHVVLHAKPRGEFLPLSFSSAAGTRAYKLYIPSGYQGRPCP